MARPVSLQPPPMAGAGDSVLPAASEIASLCCHCPCVCRLLGPRKDESHWKSISCCGCFCEDSRGLQDHTLETFFINGELLLFEKVGQRNSTTQKNARGIARGYAASPREAAELRCAATVRLDVEGRAAVAVHRRSPPDLLQRFWLQHYPKCLHILISKPCR